MKEKIENAIALLTGIILVLVGGYLFIKSTNQYTALFSGMLMGWGSLLYAIPILTNVKKELKKQGLVMLKKKK